jgi:hypothetical protein
MSSRIVTLQKSVKLFLFRPFTLTCSTRINVPNSLEHIRILIGTKRQEVAGGWRRLHNEELHNLHTSSNIIRVIKSRRMRWALHVAHIGGRRNVYKFLFGNPEGKRPLGRSGRR